jgi:hypothetical protein
MIPPSAIAINHTITDANHGTVYFAGARGLPNLVREQLLQTYPHAAYVLDALRAVHFIERSVATIKEIHQAVAWLGVSARAVRQAVQAPVFVKVQDRQSARGAPAAQFVVPNLEDIIERCGLDRHNQRQVERRATISDPLHLADFASLRVYRVALHREFIARQQEQNAGHPVSFSRKLLAERLGVSNPTSRAYDKLAGVEVEPHIETEELSGEDLDQLPRHRPRKWGKRWLQAVKEDESKHLPYLHAPALHYWKLGYVLYCKTQFTNWYSVRRE